MILPDIIKQVENSPDYVIWTANKGKNPVCDLTRVAGFIIHEDYEHITFFLPRRLFRNLESNLSKGSNINILFASIKDFQSYQIKGNYENHCDGNEENFNFYKGKVQNVIDIMTSMGLNGQLIMGYLLEQPSVAVTMYCREVYVQTPKPGTGYKINENHVL